MAACATTYFESGRGLAPRIEEHNGELMAQQPMRRRRMRTPEFHFVHHFDNSRLVKAPDPVRARQMRVFSAAVTVLFSLIMVYGLQHFYAIESSYHVESEKQSLEQLREQNRQLRLSEAVLTQPAASTRWPASWDWPRRSPVRWCTPMRSPVPALLSWRRSRHRQRHCDKNSSESLLAMISHESFVPGLRHGLLRLELDSRCRQQFSPFAAAGTPRASRAIPLKRGRFWIICLFFLLWTLRHRRPAVLAADRSPQGVCGARRKAAAAHL